MRLAYAYKEVNKLFSSMNNKGVVLLLVFKFNVIQSSVIPLWIYIERR